MLVVFILDKSGSMDVCKEATISGFNEYIEGLAKQKGVKYKMSLTLFDNLVENRYTNKSLSFIGKLNTKNYKPSGSTAMYDAIHKTLVATEKDIDDKAKVLCVIMTDGEENASSEVTEKQVSLKIKELENKNWSFVFLGANQDAWVTGQKFGFSKSNTATYNASMRGMSTAFSTLTNNTSSYGASSASVNNSFFSEEDQNNLKNSN